VILGNLLPLKATSKSFSLKTLRLMANAPVTDPISFNHQTASGATFLSKSAINLSGNCEGTDAAAAEEGEEEGLFAVPPPLLLAASGCWAAAAAGRSSDMAKLEEEPAADVPGGSYPPLPSISSRGTAGGCWLQLPPLPATCRYTISVPILATQKERKVRQLLSCDDSIPSKPINATTCY